MMSKADEYRERLRSLEDWEAYLLAESRLPGPRGNIELAQAVAEEGSEVFFERMLAYDAGRAPTNTPGEFLAFCGVLGQGRLLAEGRSGVLERLRNCANDPRWRVREATAIALQRWGAVDMDALLEAMAGWATGSLLEGRAAAAALCEPSLLRVAIYPERVLDILDTITVLLERSADRKSEDFRSLRKGLGYCWSVAVAAYPEDGKARFERWLACDDPDVRWVMKENLKKKRLEHMDSAWVIDCRKRLSGR